MWKKYLAFAVAIILVLHTVSAPVYAEEGTGAAQSGTVDLETEEKAESEEETDDLEETEQPGEGKNDGVESVQPGQEESGENAGEKQPGESIEEGMEQPEEDAGQEQPGENEETEPEQSVEQEVEQPEEDIVQEAKEEETEFESLPAVSAIGSTGEYQPEGASYKLTYTEVTGGVKITGITGTKEGELKIPATIGGMDVVEIGDRAFDDCDKLTGELVIPDGVIVIGRYAFGSCKSLTGDLRIPDSVTTIGEWAFYNCSGLTGNLVISKNVKVIGGSAFIYCRGLTGDLLIPDSVETIGEGAFSSCDNLTGKLVLPKHMTKITKGAFRGCGITSMSLEGITEIEDGAFSYCNKLEGDLVIPDSVMTIGERAFLGCSNLTGELTLPKHITSISNSAFSGTGVTAISLEGIVQIGDHAFEECKQLTGKLVLSDSVTSIGEYAFSRCTGLTGDLVIPDSLTSIGKYAFWGCDGLTGKLVLPENMTKITPYAFASCGITAVDFTEITEIGEGAFSDCSGLQGDLVIPDSITLVGKNAFNGCNGLTGKLVLPENMTKITPYAFAGSGITEADFSKITEIGEGGFFDCSGLTDIILPENVTTIGDKAFLRTKSGAYKLTLKSRNVVIGAQGLGCDSFIYGYSGSTAEAYASDSVNQCLFFSLDSAEEHEIEECRVSTTEELMAALGSYKRIILADGVYRIVEEYEKGSNETWWHHVPGTGTLLLKNLISVSIEAEHPGRAEILSRVDEEYAAGNAYARSTVPVVEITGCKDIKIEGCILGHESELADCDPGANVVNIMGSCDVDIRQCDLFGCGHVGICCNGAENIDVSQCVIRDCKLNILDGYGAKNLHITDCILSGHKSWHGLAALSCSGDVSFNNCKFLNNEHNTFDKYGNVKVCEDCTFYNNKWDGGTPDTRSGICLNGITWQLEYVRGSWSAEDLEYILKLGYPLKFDKGIIESDEGTLLDYSDAALPWKDYKSWITEIKYYDGSEPTDSVESITLDKNTLTLSAGETAMLKAEIIPNSAVASITWTSSNTSVAQVENGLVTAVSKGECTITASTGGKAAYCDVVVTASEEDDPMKRAVHISGIKPKSKVYDGNPYSYIGTAVLLDTSGNQVSGVSLTGSYSGTLSDGTVYAETEEAPSQAGSYTLSFKMSGSDADRYNLIRSSYSFDIMRKAVTITAESVEVEVGDPLPEVSELKYTVDGLIENEKLPGNPSLKYSTDNISTDREGKYGIIPYDADEGNNYRIKYVDGVLLVGNYGEIPVEDIPHGGVIPEGLWIAGLAENGYDYTGKAIKPQVRVYDYKTPLKEKTDYTIAYTRNTKSYDYDSGEEGFDAKKAPTITVTAKGNYSGKETVTFKIRPLDICEDSFSVDDIAVAYKAKGIQKPIPTLTWNGKKLKNRTDYTVDYYDNKDNELDAVKEVGQYYIVIAGKGNFAGSRSINLTVTERMKLMGKVSVASIKNQPYTGDDIMPTLTVKDGRTTLIQDVHYMVGYSQNTEVGTAYAVIMGIEEAGYCGTKRVSFKITGTPIKKASVTGLTGQKFVYEGADITPQIQLGIKTNANGTEKPLILGTDYTVTWQKNRNAGTATVLFTGKGAYTGTLKKTFKIGKFDIKTNADGRFTASVEQAVIPYAKGGAKPKVAVQFKNSEGNWQTLVEGQDYTLSYKNHTAVNDGSRADKKPTVIVKGKGNFSGTLDSVLNYQIKEQDLGQLSIVAQDKTYQNKKNIYATKLTVTDLDGKILRAGTDYNRTPIYTYGKDTVVIDAENYGTATRAAGDLVGKYDIIPAGTRLNVRIDAKGGSNYTGTLTGVYRITQAAIASASISIPKQTYTGQAIVLDKSQITVKLKGKMIEQDQYEIVPNSYKNNVKKGTASVTVRGVNNYGGTKTVKFSIRAKGFVWWM